MFPVLGAINYAKFIVCFQEPEANNFINFFNTFIVPVYCTDRNLAFGRFNFFGKDNLLMRSASHETIIALRKRRRTSFVITLKIDTADLVIYGLCMDYGLPLVQGESIQRVVRRHWASLVPSFVSAAAPTILALALAYLDSRYPASIPFPQVLVVALIIILTVLAAIFLYSGFYVFERNLLIFTSIRLFETEQLSIFNRRLAQLDLSRVQDATGSRVGFWGTLLNYGSLEIQSAGETEQFIFNYAPNPTQLAADALQAHSDFMNTVAAPVAAPSQP
jgi:hypothetical protein